MLAKDLASSASAKSIRKVIEVDGINTVYYEYPGSGEAKETLVMIHGYRGNHRGLEAIAAGLDKYKVIIPDLPGFGESEQLVAEHSLDNYSKWLRGFLLVLGLGDEVHLVGHSFGTLVVGHYATENNPKSVSLVNPVSAPALLGKRAMLTNLTKIYYLLASFAPKFAGEWLLRNKAAVMVMSVVMAKTKNKSLRRWIHHQHLSNFSDFASVQVATEGYQASISADLSSMAPNIAAPVLVVAATLDDITDIKTQREVAGRYKNSTFREIESVGHLVHYEAPDQAASHIVSFIDGLK